jgi:hypothetical protein
MFRVLFIFSGRRGHAGGVRPLNPRTIRTSILGTLSVVLTLAAGYVGASETESIEIHGAAAAQAEIIRQHAEAVRRQIIGELLGDPTPRPWTVPCEVHVHTSEAGFAAAVGGPPGGAGGATSIEFSGDQVSLRRIDVLGDLDVPDALAHELVHVVLADRFTDGPPPRWADEGLAILFDSLEKKAGHEADFQVARHEGMIWSSAHLFAMEEYPAEQGRQRVFYGQSAALVRWLIARRDMASFLNFVEDAARDGSRDALDRHYSFASTEALDRAWLAAPSQVDISLD